MTRPPALPWQAVDPLAAAEVAEVRRRAIFECCKWDPQVEDVAALAPFPVLLRPSVWQELAGLAETLAAEAAEAEEELLRRPELHRELGLPRPVRRALAPRRWGRRAPEPCPGIARVMRFDFHWTADGWRISEANTDVPGGFNEGSGLTRLMAARYGAEPAGDPAGALAGAVATATPPGAAVALVHATAYTDDRQVMTFVGRELAARGRQAVLAAPDHLRWQAGRAAVATAWYDGEVAAVIRFFPGEWLPNLPRASGWQCFFRGGATPVSNPASALLTQSKRFPLVWDRLGPLPTWRRLLPETVDPRALAGRRAEQLDRWVLKPALGRLGDGIGLAGAVPPRELERIRRAARRRPAGWAAQRRFEAVPLTLQGADPDRPEALAAVYPCIGVFTVDGRAAGAYGRTARSPLVDHLAQDTAVLVARRQAAGATGDEEHPDERAAAV